MEKRLAILSDAMQAFAEVTSDRARLLDLVARRMAEALDASSAFALVSEDGQRLEPAAFFDHDTGIMAAMAEIAARGDIPLDAPHPLLRALVENRVATMAISEELVRTRFSHAEDADRILAFQPRWVMYVPLRTRGRLVGGVTMFRCGEGARPFDPHELELARNLADHAALAIANAQLLARTQRLSDRLRLLSELAREFATSESDGRQLLALVAKRIAEVVGDGCVVRVIGEDGRTFEVPSVVAHPDPHVAAALDDMTVEYTTWLEGSAVGRAIATGASSLWATVDLDQLEAAYGAAYRASVERTGLTSMLVVPLRANNTTIGICALCRTTPNSPFTEDDRHLAEDVATHAALAIANSRLLEASRRELAERLRTSEASRLKSEFLANMSHELRTPLNAIIGFASLMHAGKVGPLSAPHKEYVGDILQSGRHLLQLINDVLDLSKIEAGHVELRVETVDLTKLAPEAHAIVRGLASEKRIRVSIDVAPELTAVNADPRLIKQVLYNYLSNAIKFTPEGGRVALKITAHADTYRIDVADTGVGIRAEDIKRLFVEFQQLDQGTSKRYPGTGLGLALTKRIVEAQGGRVSVTSAVGTGSTFTAVLPRSVAATPHAQGS